MARPHAPGTNQPRSLRRSETKPFEVVSQEIQIDRRRETSLPHGQGALMTLSPRSHSKLAAFGPFALAVVLGGLLGMTGCEDKHIGRVCSLDVPDASVSQTGTTATFNGQAVECPTRICVLPAAQKQTNTTALCSAFCSSDDDCDGETTSNPSSGQCKSGFACVYPTPVGAFCCQKMCVCKDFIDTMNKNFHDKPTSCNPPSTCQNVH
jgi:hypothetical protein